MRWDTFDLSPSRTFSELVSHQRAPQRGRDPIDAGAVLATRSFVDAGAVLATRLEAKRDTVLAAALLRSRLVQKASMLLLLNRKSAANRLLLPPFAPFADRRASASSGAGFRMPAGRDLSGGAAAGVRKPPRKEPAGAWWAAWRLWGFGWVAAWVGAALVWVVGGGPTMAVASWSLQRRSTG
jgi:hypothetical protein